MAAGEGKAQMKTKTQGATEVSGEIIARVNLELGAFIP